MVQLNFFEQVLDTASRIVPTPYSALLEECTAPHLVNPTLPHIDILVYKIQNVPDDVGEILRAIRRRLHDDNGYVRQLTIKVLTHLIRKGNPDFHDALAEHKGLLKELQDTATSTEHNGNGWEEARKSARQLILNLNSWFLNYPNPNTHSLVNLATEVKLVSGPTVFSGMTPDTTAKIAVPDGTRPPPTPALSSTGNVNIGNGDRRSHARTSHGPSKTSGSVGGGGRVRAGRKPEEPKPNEKPAVVDAIPVFLPTESTISTMLENCTTLSEYLPNAATNPTTGAFLHDDVLSSFCSTIKKEHASLSLLLSSDLELDRDLLRFIAANQARLLSEITVGRKKQERSANTETASTAVAPTTAVSAAIEAATTTTTTVSNVITAYPPAIVPTPEEKHPKKEEAKQQQQEQTAPPDTLAQMFGDMHDGSAPSLVVESGNPEGGVLPSAEPESSGAGREDDGTLVEEAVAGTDAPVLEEEKSTGASEDSDPCVSAPPPSVPILESNEGEER